jgi:transcriptional regulator with XRE-family HTH domain
MKVVTIYIRLQELLKERGMSQLQLAHKTGIRTAAISEICNNLRTTINRDHLQKIADVLGLNDIHELIELRTEEQKD